MRSARPPPERLPQPADRPGCYRPDGGHRCHSRLCQALPGCAADVSVVLFLGDDVSAIELFSPSPGPRHQPARTRHAAGPDPRVAPARRGTPAGTRSAGPSGIAAVPEIR